MHKNEKRPPKSSKNKMFIFGLHSTSDDQPSNLSKNIDQNAKKKKHKKGTPKSLKNKMFIFGLHSTSDDQPGWLMDLNPIHHPSPAKKKMKCLFLDYIQLLMIGQAGQWTQTPSATPLWPKK